MTTIKLIKTTKVKGAFVAGGTELSIGKDISKEDAKSLVDQKIAHNANAVVSINATAKDKEIETLKSDATAKDKEIETLKSDATAKDKEIETLKKQITAAKK